MVVNCVQCMQDRKTWKQQASYTISSSTVKRHVISFTCDVTMEVGLCKVLLVAVLHCNWTAYSCNWLTRKTWNRGGCFSCKSTSHSPLTFLRGTFPLLATWQQQHQGPRWPLSSHPASQLAFRHFVCVCVCVCVCVHVHVRK